jgi:hypothetical protein
MFISADLKHRSPTNVRIGGQLRQFGNVRVTSAYPYSGGIADIVALRICAMGSHPTRPLHANRVFGGWQQVPSVNAVRDLL